MCRSILLAAFGLCVACLAPIAAHAEVYVIANPAIPVEGLTANQVSDLYLGRARSVDVSERGATNTIRIVVYEQKDNSPIREAFFRMLNGTGLDEVIAYWARLRFSGQVMPPEALRDSRAILEKVRSNRNAIGYVEAEHVDRTVKVLLRLPS